MVFHVITTEYAFVTLITWTTNVMHVMLVFLTFRHVKVNPKQYYVIQWLTFVTLISKLAIVTEMDRLALHVMTLVCAVVKPISWMTNVIHVMLVFLTSQHVKVNNTSYLCSTYNKRLTLMRWFFKFQPVIVMEMGQMVFHAITTEYALVKPISWMTNVMRVTLVFLTFQHAKVINSLSQLL